MVTGGAPLVECASPRPEIVIGLDDVFCSEGTRGMSVHRRREEGSTTPTRRVKRELLKIDGKTVEVILRHKSRARVASSSKWILRRAKCPSSRRPHVPWTAPLISRAKKRTGSPDGSPRFPSRCILNWAPACCSGALDTSFAQAKVGGLRFGSTGTPCDRPSGSEEAPNILPAACSTG